MMLIHDVQIKMIKIISDDDVKIFLLCGKLYWYTIMFFFKSEIIIIILI